MTCCDAAAGLNLMDEKQTRIEALRGAAIQLENKHFQSDFVIADMHCAACIAKLERGFEGEKGIKRVRANLSLKRLSVVWEEGQTSPDKIETHIRSLGFSSNPFDLSSLSNTQDKQSRELAMALGIAGFAAMNVMLLSVSVWSGADAATTQLFHLISGVIAIPAVFYSGQPFFKSAFSALRVGRLNMDVPISLAVLLALGMSVIESLTGGAEAYFDAAVSLLFFLLIGRYLDHLMRRRARHAVDQLSHLTNKGAIVILKDGRPMYRPLQEIKPGDCIEVKPGDRIPLDCNLITQEAKFDRSLVTGESVPVSLEKGAEVEAGTLLLNSPARMEVLRAEDRSFIANIVKLMEAAEGSRNTYVRVADRMAQIYAPAVHLLAFFTFICWMIATGDWHISLYTAIAVLIVTCPCALGLAVPVVHVIAATRLFKHGIMMKDGSALERAAEIDTVFFDKTGTLTSGGSEDVCIKGDESLLALAKTLAEASSHPYARAISCQIAIAPARCENLVVQEHVGDGVEARVGDFRIRLGRADWVRVINPKAGDGAVICADNTGRSVSFELREALRSGAYKAVQDLKKTVSDILLLSGDAEQRVRAVAHNTNIQTILANQRPDDKINAIKAATNQGSKVLMVGDGLNDAAALSQAHVSVAPASACDVGRSAADFVFTRENLEAVPQILLIARKAAWLVKQNFALALLYNCIAVPCAMAGVVSPLFAALAMSFSSIVVIANSMRLNLHGHTKRDRVDYSNTNFGVQAA